uniref:FYVE-type domain-containing protein n=1 Tax=Lactuca sativa TaxID=4236 RepID=A0A9R1XW12_LACSA|nr:hypothetical protein LSAT_V11C100044720 [Lactuca sativa]
MKKNEPASCCRFSVAEVRSSISSLDDAKIVKATLKVHVNEDMKSGVQKFCVILLSEGGGVQGDMDVLCQIGLDGIQMLDPATNRTLKLYSLEFVTRWEVMDLNVFVFWTKTSIDVDERRVRLKSNSYTTTNILDMVAAVPDEASTKCTTCKPYFGAFVRRHHCRNCGDIFCDKCTQGRIALTTEENAQQVRVCDQCMAEVTQRLSHVNKVAGRGSSGFNRHEDLTTFYLNVILNSDSDRIKS